ncbi:MAG: beta-galactosidase [Firmicutes bacterium]|nr:beta-galactosidase [[Eubacterium] siraeum]MCM1487079.1 beta-galactosidase [Bacillota bacterium]
MLEIKDKFYLNGEPFQIISGSFHYFRTLPEYWRDRLEKLVNMGCNTVETYIPWNFHQPNKGEFLWQGRRSICRFIETAQELGLYMIIRPSPYICAEWEFGGLPAWLLADRNMRLRCCFKPYLDAVKDYYSELMPRLAPYQADRGGNIILMQIENEYGYYGDDKAYLKFLCDTMRQLGITVPFVTSDGPWSEAVFKSGMTEGALPTGNFGSSAQWQFGQMKKLMGDNMPLMCMEFWNGWFDAWGEEHHTTPAEKAAQELDALLSMGSVNLYMFEGGTSFGFMNGRNCGNKTADVTSYDYDAPLTEDGRITEKYNSFKRVISKYRSFEQIPLTTEIRRKTYGEIACSGRISLFSALEKLSAPLKSVYPLSMEEAGQSYGYILYRLHVSSDEAVSAINLENAADRVLCFRNGKRLFTAEGDELYNKFEPRDLPAGGVFDLLCENIGRENFGTGLENQRKGIMGGVKLNDRRCYGYEIFRLPLDEKQIAALDFDADSRKAELSENAPAFYRFEFTAEDACDTFLDTEGFGRGCAFINGFNLGRFWEIGPQKRLYIPAPLIKRGINTIVLFETEGKSSQTVFLSDSPRPG